MESLHFCVADYAASTKAKTTVIGGPNPNYHVLTDIDGENPREKHWGDMWHHAVSKMVIAARANGLRPIDGPFGTLMIPMDIGLTTVRQLWVVKEIFILVK